MKNGEYWKKRIKAAADDQYSKSATCYSDIEKEYKKAISGIESDMSVWYQRIAENNEVSYAAAKKLLKKSELDEFKWTVEEYIEAGKDNAVNQRWMKQLENASARYHISRLEAIKLQLRQRAELVSAKLDNKLAELTGEVYKDKYYKTAYEFMKQVGVGSSFAKIDDSSLDTLLRTPWAQDGKTFSDRIWDNKEKLVRNLHTELTQGLIRGTSPQKMIASMQKSMNVSRNQAANLILTETAAISAKATQDSYKELGVEEFEVLETLDSRTCSICADMDGRHFPMSQYQIGLTAPPFHPRCRGTTVPYYDDEFTADELRAARDENDSGYELVPGDMTYKEWKERVVDGEKVEKNAADDIITSGARITNPESKEGIKFAESFYPEIRKRTTDCKKIAANTGKTEEEIQRIKNYLFMDDSLYLEKDKIWRQFYPDCAIAQSWQRLTDGKDIKSHDLTLIEHELYEMQIKEQNPGISHDEAHEIAQMKYNYADEVNKYYDNIAKLEKKL